MAPEPSVTRLYRRLGVVILALMATAATAATTAVAATTTAATTTTTAAAAAGSPSVTLTPPSSGPVPKTVNVLVKGCASGPIKITDSLNGGSQTIARNRAPATVVSHGTPGTYTVTATCSNGAAARALFIVTRKKLAVKLSPSTSGPVTKTINVSVIGCPPGSIKITDTINGGSQTIKHDGAPATIVSQGTPGKYKVTATCTDGVSAHAGFVVSRGSGPKVKLRPSSSGPVTKTINISVTGCPPGSIKITDTINGGSETIKHDDAPATVVSQGQPGNYTVTAKCADGTKGHAAFVVTPDGPIQTGDGTTSRPGGPWVPLGIALVILGAAGGTGLCFRRRGDGRRLGG